MKNDLVLLHGWGFQSSIWEHFIPYLQDQFNIIPLDLTGFGANPLPRETMTLNGMANNILEQTPESAIFLGWSLGGLVAMNIAIHHPNRISHLITFSSTPKFVADEQWPGMALPVLNQFHHALKLDYKATLQQFALLQFQGSDTNRSIIKAIKKLISEGTPPSERALQEGLDILQKTDLRSQLINIQCPQQYFFGRCDTLTPVAVAEKLQLLTSNAKIEILDKLSHAPFLSNPSLCAEKIKTFLS